MARPHIAPYSQELARRTALFGAQPTIADFFKFVNDPANAHLTDARTKVQTLWTTRFTEYQASPTFATDVANAEQEILAANPSMTAADAHAAAERKVRSDFRIDFGPVGEIFMKVLRAAVPTSTFISESKAIVAALDETDKKLPANFNTAANLKNNKFVREEQEHFRRFLILHESDDNKRREHEAELVDITKQPANRLTLYTLFTDHKDALAAELSTGAATPVLPDSIAENNFVQLIINYINKDDASATRFLAFIKGLPLTDTEKTQMINELKLQPTTFITEVVQSINRELLGTQKTVADLNLNQFAALFVKQQLVHASPTDATPEKWELYKLLEPARKAELVRLLGGVDPATLDQNNLFEKILDYITDPATLTGLNRADAFLNGLKTAVAEDAAAAAAGTRGYTAKLPGITPDILDKITGEVVTLQNARGLHLDAALVDDYVSLPVAFTQDAIKKPDGTYVVAYDALRNAAITAAGEIARTVPPPPGMTAADAVTAAQDALRNLIDKTQDKIKQNKNYKLDAAENPYLAVLGDQIKAAGVRAGFIFDAAVTNPVLAEGMLNLPANVNIATLQPSAVREQLFSAFLPHSAPNVNYLLQMLNPLIKAGVAATLGVDPNALSSQNLMLVLFNATNDQIANLNRGLTTMLAAPPAGVPVTDILNQLTQVQQILAISDRDINQYKNQFGLAQFYQKLPAKPAINAALVTNDQAHKDRVKTLTDRSDKLVKDSTYQNLQGRAEKVITYYNSMLVQMDSQLRNMTPGTDEYKQLEDKIETSLRYLSNLKAYRADVSRIGTGQAWTQPEWGQEGLLKELANIFAPSLLHSPYARRSATVLTSAQASAARTTAGDGNKYTITRSVHAPKAEVMCELTRVVDANGKKLEKLTFVSDPKNYLSTKFVTKEITPKTGAPYTIETSEMQNSAAKCIAYACNNGGMLVYNEKAGKFEMPPPSAVFDADYFNGTKDAYGRQTGGALADNSAFHVASAAISTILLPITLPLNLIGLAISAPFAKKPIWETFLSDWRGVYFSAQKSATNKLESAFVTYWFQEKLTQGLLATTHCISEDVKKAHDELIGGGESKRVYDRMLKPGGQLYSLDATFKYKLSQRQLRYATTAEADQHKTEDTAFVLEKMLLDRDQRIPPEVRQHYEELLRDLKGQKNAQEEPGAGPRSTVTLNPGS